MVGVEALIRPNWMVFARMCGGENAQQ
jgi:hypothetical protein